jgi:hypothetical protein
MREIFQQAEEENHPVPSEVNMGCVAFKGKGA